MKIDNPLYLNDWEIKKFLGAVLAIQLAVWLVTGLAAVNINLPIIGPAVSLVYLLFIPGVIILRILGLHKLSSIETLLYSVGLSLATIIFTGLLVNAVFPFWGISRPISSIPLVSTLSGLILILCVVSYVRDRGFSAPAYLDLKQILSPAMLFLCLIPCLSILGTYLVNFKGNNIVLMLLIGVIALTVLLMVFGIIPKNLYPMALFAIAVSLLFHRSLISMYITGFDIHEEYYFANRVLTDGVWDPTVPRSLNSLLSITMLGPITSIISSLSLTWVFKIIYPLLFSLVPLGLYRVFQKQTDETVAFLSCFFFMAVYEFYTEMPVLPRQQIATVFLVGLVLLLVDKRAGKMNRAFLSIVFGVSLIVSHYGLSYIFMFYLIFAWLILVLGSSPKWQKLGTAFYARFGGYKKEGFRNSAVAPQEQTLGLVFVLLFIAFALAWYMYTSGATAFDTYVYIGKRIYEKLSEFLNPEYSHGLTLLLSGPKSGLLHQINSAINYANQFFILVGILVLLVRHRKMKFEREFGAFSVLSLAILLAGVLVPVFSKEINMERLYHIALIFLAPFFVIGGLTLIRIAGWFARKAWTEKSRWLPNVLSLYLAIFLLFQTGFVWQLTDGYSMSVSLSGAGLEKYGSPEMKATYYSAVTPEQDVLSAEWLSKHRQAGEKIYAMYTDVRVHALRSYGMIPSEDIVALARTTGTIPQGAYVYLQYLNVVEHIGTEFNANLLYGKELSAYDMNEVSHLLAGKNRIYSNGGSEIYK